MKILKKISYILMVSLFLFITSSCEKEKLSKEELLTNHIWKWNKMITSSENENIQDIVTLVNALMTGATLEFNDDGTYSLTALNTSDDGIWELLNDETLLMETDEMTIKKLTDTELIMEGEEETEQYGSYLYEMHWKK